MEQARSEDSPIFSLSLFSLNFLVFINYCKQLFLFECGCQLYLSDFDNLINDVS